MSEEQTTKKASKDHISMSLDPSASKKPEERSTMRTVIQQQQDFKDYHDQEVHRQVNEQGFWTCSGCGYHLCQPIPSALPHTCPHCKTQAPDKAPSTPTSYTLRRTRTKSST